MLTLTDQEVRAVATIPRAIDALHIVYKGAGDEAPRASRVNLPTATGYLRMMGAVLPGRGVLGYKAFHRSGSSVRYAIHLFALDGGQPLAVIDGAYLTALRTSATAALAARHFAPRGPQRVGVIGTGAEAQLQVLAMGEVLSIEEVAVYSPNPASRERFVEKMSRSGIAVDARTSPKETLREAQICIAATNTSGRGPALTSDDLGEHMTYLSSIGSTLPNQRELDTALWSWAERCIVDTPDVFEESGDALAAVKAGVLLREDCLTLSEALNLEPSKVAPARSTIYKSIGSGIQDVAVAHAVYEAAVAEGIGRQVEPVQSVKTM